jgi:dTDP-4-amino-4,6-dideoxygalactose transaminase
VTLPFEREGARHIYNQYVVRVPGRRNELKDYLAGQGIGTDIYYPVPLHLQECFAYLGYREGDLPVSEKAAKETLALPIYPELTTEQQEYVVNNIAEFFK